MKIKSTIRTGETLLTVYFQLTVLLNESKSPSSDGHACQNNPTENKQVRTKQRTGSELCDPFGKTSFFFFLLTTK